MERMENRKGSQKDKSKSSIVPVSCLQGTANYNSSLCGIKNSVLFLFCFGASFSPLPHVSQWEDWCKFIRPSCLSVCLPVYRH